MLKFIAWLVGFPRSRSPSWLMWRFFTLIYTNTTNNRHQTICSTLYSLFKKIVLYSAEYYGQTEIVKNLAALTENLKVVWFRNWIVSRYHFWAFILGIFTFFSKSDILLHTKYIKAKLSIRPFCRFELLVWPF